ncbi:MAG: quinolinate synthase NadA [Blautia sp.]
MNHIQEEIIKLKKENNAAIMAHYYVPDQIQEIADYIGDSYYLSKLATQIPEDIIVLCGVSFMGESAKILNAQKTVLLPEPQADCPMAHMASTEKIEEMRAKYDDLAVVCYINSTAELKAHSDVCVTSANAISIVRSLPNANIYFIPDQNLGSQVARQVPEKHVILNDGYCHVHHRVTVRQVEESRKEHPHAKFLVHPECPPQVVSMADYVGSTSGIIQDATESPATEFIIGTENGVFHQLQKKNPSKRFYPLKGGQICPDMKKLTLQKIRDCLISRQPQVEVSQELSRSSQLPLNRMLQLAK